MNGRTRLVLAAAVGAMLGALGARVVLVGSGLNLVVWAVGGLLVGAAAPTRRTAGLAGGAYGLALAVTFIVVGYDGRAGVLARALFFAGCGLVGAACGGVLGIVGRLVAQRRARAR